MAENKRLRMTVEGKVQGVGFRHYTIQRAGELSDVSGWVKNEPDGSVTVLAEGPEDQLRKLEKAVEKGPSFARVEQTHSDWKSYQDEFNQFSVKY